jgi:hypothetical protein
MCGTGCQLQVEGMAEGGTSAGCQTRCMHTEAWMGLETEEVVVVAMVVVAS